MKREIQHLTKAEANRSEYLMQIKALCLAPLYWVLEYILAKNLTDFLKTFPHTSLNWIRRYRLAHDIIQGSTHKA